MDGTISVITTMTWLATLGRTWRKMIRGMLAPTASAARTYSAERSASVLPRISRDRDAQRRKDRIAASTRKTCMGGMLRGTTATKAR